MAMPKTTPSQVATAIESMFGAASNDLAETAPNQTKQVEVRALLSLLDDLPNDLPTLSFTDNLEFVRCRAALATVLPMWSRGETRTTNAAGKNPVERIRRLLKACPDELPRPESELTFITDEDTRLEVEAKLHTAWINFKAGEWLGATAFAGIALEAMLLWEVKRAYGSPKGRDAKSPAPKRPVDEWRLDALITEALKLGSISKAAADQAHLARDGRNLIHPGKMASTGTPCSRATALTAFAAAYQVAEELGRKPVE
jgi:hypothetical protein